MFRFNAPPGWPVAQGWTPPENWKAPTDWPAAPQDWQWWVQEPQAVPAQALSPDVNADLQILLTTPVSSLTGDDGKFGRKARLESQVEQLAQFADRLQRALLATVGELRTLGALEASELAVETARRQALLEHLNAKAAARQARVEAEAQEQLREISARTSTAAVDLNRLRNQIDKAKETLVETRESLILQEVGIYEFTHPLEDAVAYKAKLESLKDRYKALAKNNRAVSGDMTWQVNGSSAKGQKMVRETSKLMLRAYNAEADNLVRTMKPYKLASAVARLQKAGETISRLGSTMNIRITNDYHRLRVQELELTADYLEKTAQEKERIREQRAQEREEEKAQREFLRRQEKFEKERIQIQTALERLTAEGDPKAIEELTAKLAEVDASIADVKARQANIASGFVYVISNRGAFGPNIVKIGMTRREEPQERVNELGDASVPFRFDVHATIYSDDARGLEARLHQTFAEQRVNRVNLRREFFYVTPAQVREALAKMDGEHLLDFKEQAEAYEWHASGGEARVR